jgi:hypothetical protein
MLPSGGTRRKHCRTPRGGLAAGAALAGQPNAREPAPTYSTAHTEGVEKMTREAVRRWMAGHEAAAEVDRLERLNRPASAQESLEHLEVLVGFAMGLHGWPLPRDAVSERELVEAREAWARLRDRDDVEHLLVRYGKQVDLDRIRSWVRQFAEVLETPERLDEFEQLLQRAQGRT